MLVMTIVNWIVDGEEVLRFHCTECEDKFDMDEAMDHAEKVHFCSNILIQGNQDPLERHSILLADS